MKKNAFRPVTVRGITIGEGLPKICMPLVAEDEQELQAAAQEAVRLRPDLVEWRADSYRNLKEDEIPGLISRLHAWVGEMPVLFTFRSKEEGGARPLAPEKRQQLLMRAAGSGADLLDAELALGENALHPLLAQAHSHRVPVILSSHCFERTPPVEELLTTLRREQEAGASIAKLAVMPCCPADVLALLEATLRMREQFAEIPLITMSMGEMGLPSRVCGGIFGSDLSFGAGSSASAPGQIGVRQLRAFLQAVGPSPADAAADTKRD